MNTKIQSYLKFTLPAVFALAVLGMLPGNVSGATYTFNWVPTGIGPDVFPLVSITGSITLDASLFDTSNADQTILFRTGPAAFNVAAFHFVLVSNVMGTDVTDTFDLANIAINSGASFNSTTHPPTWLDATGGDTPSNEGDGEVLHLSDNFQIDMLGPHNETSFGSFVVTTVPEPSTWICLVLGAAIFVLPQCGCRRSKSRHPHSR